MRNIKMSMVAGFPAALGIGLRPVVLAGRRLAGHHSTRGQKEQAGKTEYWRGLAGAEDVRA